VNAARRAWLLGLAGLPVAAFAQPAPLVPPVQRGRALAFPRDHGAHLDARTEWWYATGWLGTEAAPTHGFQLTFFRSRTDLAGSDPSRFAPRHLLFAHAALTDLLARRHHHAQRIARWSGDAAARPAFASTRDAAVAIGDWSFAREGDRWRAQLPAGDFTLELGLARAQPLLLQGDAGFSRKGPGERQASHYYSVPQLATTARITLAGRGLDATGRAWLDHEWSEELLHPDAVGWDWIGMNLFDGSALTAFALRRADGSSLWTGGSWRGGAAGSTARAFGPGELTWTAGRRWRSPATRAEYPMQWRVHTPAGRFEVRALLDVQELDARGSSGAVYWEGLAELLDERGARVGLGYLEMTGYAARLRVA
jgi:predicted secreted hydrolase